MRLVVDELPQSCRECLWCRNELCNVLMQSISELEEEECLEDCPLVELKDNVEITTDEVDVYGSWERRYAMTLDGKVISKWKEDIYGRHSNWND